MPSHNPIRVLSSFLAYAELPVCGRISHQMLASHMFSENLARYGKSSIHSGTNLKKISCGWNRLIFLGRVRWFVDLTRAQHQTSRPTGSFCISDSQLKPVLNRDMQSGTSHWVFPSCTCQPTDYRNVPFAKCHCIGTFRGHSFNGAIRAKPPCLTSESPACGR